MKIKKIKFQDLYTQYKSIKKEIDLAIKNTIKHSSFVRGSDVDLFEKEFAKSLGLDHCISCGNGTDALYIGMKALNLNKNDEVIVPAVSWISTSESVTQAGGKVVFCDVLRKNLTINPRLIEEKITKKTVGIIPVHLYGHPANMSELVKIAKKYKLWIIEDCAQAHYAKIHNKFVGTFGNLSTFSFYPGKNLGAMGDAGSILTNNKDLATKMYRFARHGGLFKGEHEIEGMNSRLDGIQAAILRVKLKYIAGWTKKRQDIASLYSDLLKNIEEISLPDVENGCEHVWHLYVIKVKTDREMLIEFLKKRGIETNVNYPTSLPFLNAYKRYKSKKRDFPVAFESQSQILSLPIYPEMRLNEVRYISSEIKDYFKNQARKNI